MDQQKSFVNMNLISEAMQYRMRRLQVYNWGTFSGLHDIPISIDGFLFVGRSGSGKSTLLDALSAMLVPPLWLGFNAAAREGDKGRYDRNLPSYIRGAWADQEDSGSGEIATQYLRAKSTWSAVALEYANDAGSVVTLVQLFWLRGNSNRTADVKRHYMIAERCFDIATELNEFDLDLRKLKNKLENKRDKINHYEKFRPYSERFRRLLGIESEMALKLLHKTQSAKNLGDLNEFLRDFMLDKPQTFDVADRLVQEFAELDAAHQSVVTVRKQVNMLSPARTRYERSQKIDSELAAISALIEGIDVYRDQTKIRLLAQEIERLQTRDQGLAGQEQTQKDKLDNHKSQLSLLEEKHRERGGGQIQRLEQEKNQNEQQRDQRMLKLQQAKEACQRLDWTLSDTPQGHAELSASAREEVESWKEASERANQQRDKLRDNKKELEKEFVTVRKEIEVMQCQPSNIPFQMLELRQTIANALGLAETDLAFVGELIEVKDQEKDWQGSIERVLHGFALSVLVNEKHYAAVSKYVNETRLNKRLVYYRMSAMPVGQGSSARHNSLVNKLNLKKTDYRQWLLGELMRRFDYTCVENMKDFRQADKAITREGQIRHGKSRHEKDDRHAIDDRRYWVLGFDNKDKLKLYQERAQQLGAEISQLDEALNKLAKEKEQQQVRFEAAFILSNLQWHEIDVAGILDRISLLEKQLKELRSGNRELKNLGERIDKVKQEISKLESDLSKTRAERIDVDRTKNSHQEELKKLELQLTGSMLTEQQKKGLDKGFKKLDKDITLKNIDKQCTQVERALSSDKKVLDEERNKLVNAIEKCFSDFMREWPVESADLDSTLESAAEFVSLLQRLEHDGLPKYEERFFDMLNNQSTENLAALNKYMTQARKEIRERMELVNESLANAEFNPGTVLRIEVNERNLPDVREFRELVSKVLDYALQMDRDKAEARFNVLRELVKKLASQENEHQRWREQVLDVRQHVEFIGRESDMAGNEIEIYRSGAGKSGGQREKLATTCLAAALRYQLGGIDNDTPVYAPVVLDEAFGKADNEFTELAMKIFTTFGFQMIVATPLKSVMTLESFIGGACFVDIADRKRSSTLQIEYDKQSRRLDMTDKAEKIHGEVVSG